MRSGNPFRQCLQWIDRTIEQKRTSSEATRSTHAQIYQPLGLCLLKKGETTKSSSPSQQDLQQKWLASEGQLILFAWVHSHRRACVECSRWFVISFIYIPTRLGCKIEMVGWVVNIFQKFIDRSSHCHPSDPITCGILAVPRCLFNAIRLWFTCSIYALLIHVFYRREWLKPIARWLIARVRKGYRLRLMLLKPHLLHNPWVLKTKLYEILSSNWNWQISKS